MKYDDLTPRQRQAVESTEPVTLVKGGAGTGKTTVALWAARTHLLRDESRAGERVLFVTFSRAAVNQISKRSASALVDVRDRVEIQTFHSLGFRLIKAFGRYGGYGSERLKIESMARAKLLGSDDGRLSYDALVPGAVKLLESPQLLGLASARWSLIICDEFQDSAQTQWELLRKLGGQGRLLLLGDPNQMIYGFLPGVNPSRLKEAADEANLEVTLEPASKRDPSQVIPGMATAVLARQFGAEAIKAALESGRLEIRSCDGDQTPDEVVAEIGRQRKDGCQTISVLETTNDAVARLGAELSDRDVDYTLIGLPEAHGEAIIAMAKLVGFGLGAVEWSEAQLQIAVYLTAASRGREAPLVAKQLAGQVTGLNPVVQRGADAVIGSLKVAADRDELIDAAMEAWPRMNLTAGRSAWSRAAVSFAAIARRTMVGNTSAEKQSDDLLVACEEVQIESALTTDVPGLGSTQLMNFHQTKGREADAVILVYREGGWVTKGSASEPFVSESRVLYVALTRARKRVVLLVPPTPHPFVAPLAALDNPAG